MAAGAAADPALRHTEPVAQIRIEQLTVVRDRVTILDGVDLIVPDGGRMVLLGPSGAGKTMLLRVIAGLEEVQEGRIVFDDRDVTAVPTGERDLTMIFAQGGLQPHLNVERNIGLPLTFRKHPRDDVRRRVQTEARVFGIQRLLRRKPRTLSGGEHHQVTLAHSLVRRSNGPKFLSLKPSKPSTIWRGISCAFLPKSSRR